jgi:Lon protease-like protein
MDETEPLPVRPAEEPRIMISRIRTTKDQRQRLRTALKAWWREHVGGFADIILSMSAAGSWEVVRAEWWTDESEAAAGRREVKDLVRQFLAEARRANADLGEGRPAGP